MPLTQRDVRGPTSKGKREVVAEQMLPNHGLGARPEVGHDHRGKEGDQRGQSQSREDAGNADLESNQSDNQYQWQEPAGLQAERVHLKAVQGERHRPHVAVEPNEQLPEPRSGYGALDCDPFVVDEVVVR